MTFNFFRNTFSFQHFDLPPTPPTLQSPFANLNQIRASIHISDVRRPNETNPINAAEKNVLDFNSIQFGMVG